MRPRDGAFAGALCALSLAIGQEMAPAIATLAAALALRWIMRGEAARQATAAFGLAFAGVTLALFAATVPPVRYSVATCDALSIVQGTAAAIGGVGLAGLSAVRALTSRSRRLVAAAALGLLLGATMAFGFPACLGDPYAHLDPRISALWLSNVTEARNIVAMLRDLPQEVLPYYGLLATGFVLGLIRCAREPDDERWRWIVCFAVLATLSALSLWQVRGSASANTIAVALTPAALVRSFPAPDGRAVFLGLGRAALVAALLLNPLLLIAVGNVSARVFDAATGTSRPLIVSEGPGTCSRAADYAPLARLPRGRVLGFIDAGPFILAETPHDVFAAPYHRNVKGNAAMLDIFLARPDHAAARLAALEIDYIAFCPGAPERHNYVAAAPDGLAAALARGEVPEFLERVALDGTDLAVYRRRR